MSPDLGWKHLLRAWKVRKYILFRPWNTNSAGMAYLWPVRATLLVLGLLVTCQSQSGCLPLESWEWPARGSWTCGKERVEHLLADVCQALLSHFHLCPCCMSGGIPVLRPSCALIFPLYLLLYWRNLQRLNCHFKTPVWFLAWCPWTEPVLSENSELHWKFQLRFLPLHYSVIRMICLRKLSLKLQRRKPCGTGVLGVDDAERSWFLSHI